MSTCFDEYLPVSLSALINHIINAAKEISMKGFSKFADVGHGGLSRQD